MARPASRSRFDPGKTTTAAFMSSASDLDAVILDDGVREQLVASGLQSLLGTGLVRTRQLDVEHLALPHALDASDAERLQRPLDGLALRIEDAGLQGDGDARFHRNLALGRGDA